MFKVGITGSNGFIGKNLTEILVLDARISEIRKFDRSIYIKEGAAYLSAFVTDLDILYHLGGVNRPENIEEFELGNHYFTVQLLDAVRLSGSSAKIVYTSSSQAISAQNPYGLSKKEAELAIEKFSDDTGNNAYIYQLPNIFGKWCRPFYNSVVATFCHQISRGEAVSIHKRESVVNLLHVDRVVDSFESHLGNFEKIHDKSCMYISDFPYTTITIGDLADKIQRYHDYHVVQVANMTGFEKELYITYLNYCE